MEKNMNKIQDAYNRMEAQIRTLSGFKNGRMIEPPNRGADATSRR